MKKGIILAVLAICTTSVMRAQDKGSKGSEKAEMKIEQVLKEMNLDAEKSEAVRAVLMKRRELVEAQHQIVKNAEESIKEAKKVIKQARAEADEELKSLLTEEQMEKLKELKKPHKEGKEKPMAD